MKTQNSNSTLNPISLSRIFSAAVALLAGVSGASAASGTWSNTNTTASIWSASTNWLGGTVADAADNTADFSTVNITNNLVVTLDSSRTIGGLKFADTNGTQSWLLNPAASGSVLTMQTSSGTPTITTATNGANNFAAAINVTLAGSGGLTKAGPGILALGGTNTYTGATTVSGGTLMITNGPGQLQNGPGSLVAYYSFNTIAGNRVINEGSGGALMDGTLVGNGGVSIGAGQGRFGDNCLNVTLGALHNNNNAGAVGNGGYMLVDNAVVPFTCTAGNAAANWTWALWLKTTVTGGAYMYQGSGSWASGNTAFYLNTGAGAVGSGAKAGGVRNSQGWEGGTANINDGNWHHIAMTCTAGTKVLYVDGAVDAFLINQWSAAGAGNQLWVGGSGGTPGDGNVQYTGLIDKVAIYNRPLSLAEIQLLTNNVVPGLAAPAIPLNSSLTVAAGATFDPNGYFATVTNLAGPGTVNNTVSSWLAANYGANTTFNGVITNVLGNNLNFFKLGAGTLTNSGSMANNLTVIRQGKIELSGSGTIITNGANNTIIVADSSERAILNIPSGSTVLARNLQIGCTAGGLQAAGGGAGAVYNNGTFKNFGNTGTGAFALGNSTGGAGSTNNSYGYFLHDTAVPLALGESGVGGLGGGDGVFEVKSGTAAFTNWITIGRCQGTVSGQQQRSLFLIRGGTVLGPNFANEDRWNWSGSTINFYSVMEIGAGGTLDSLGTAHNINMGNDNNANAVSVLTVDNGGFLRVNSVNAGAANPICTVNFNNAVVAPVIANTTFLGANLDNVFVYSGGVTFSNIFDITSVPQLKAPTGNGITSIPVSTQGAGYIGRPIVQITDGSGVGATAIAEWDMAAGTVTNITITSPGSGYSSPTVTLVGGGSTTAATLGTPVLGTISSGGLTKLGTATLTLAGGYSYSGDTVVQAGTLSVPASAVTPSSAGSLSLSNGVTLSLDNSGGSSLPVNNLILAGGTTNNFNFGTVAVNPANPAINASGTVTTLGANNVINISAFGLQTGQFPLIKYTGAPLGSIANFTLGTLPPGVVATLVNNTGNNSIDLNITSTGQNLAWYGLDGVSGLINNIWGINTPTNWVSVGTTTPQVRYQEYTSGGLTVGDPVTLDDTLYNDGINPQATNINLTTPVRPFTVLLNNTLPYSIAGAGSIAGLGSIVKSNTGSLTLLTSNAFAGGINIAGGTVIVTNDFALGTNTGTVTLNTATLQVNGTTTNNSRVLVVPATSSIAVSNTYTARFGGAVSGAGGLTKVDNGTLVLAGTNTIQGNLLARQGTLSSLGGALLPAVARVGDTASLNGTLMVPSGVFNAANNGGQFTSSLMAGSAAGSFGEITVNGGTLNVGQQLGLGNGAGGYGALSISSGALNCGSYIVVGFLGDTGVYNQSGGTVTLSSNLMTIAAGGGTTAVGIANFSGGTFNSSFATSSGIMVGERGTGTMNVSGTASINTTNSNGLTVGPVGAQTGWSGTLNLNGGTVTANSIKKGLGTGSAKLNLNGGTIKAAANTSTFLNGMDLATLYANGVTVDDGGFSITIPQALTPATGAGVSSISLSSGGSGYIDSPIVTISGGSGSNATATATVSGGVVTAVVVTSPGTGYSLSDTLTVSFAGGGATAVAPTVGTVSLANNSGGGLRKLGAGTLTLNTSNSILGSVIVGAGSLVATPVVTMTGGAIVSNSASLTIAQTSNLTNVMGALTLNGAAATPGATLGVALTGQTPTIPLVNCGTLTVNGTNTLSIAGAISVGAIPVVKYSSLTGAGTLTNLTLPQGAAGFISNSVAQSTLFVVITSTGPGLVWTGFNSNPALTNLWDISSTTNWLLGATPSLYRQPIIPGDAVTFNDSGSGTVRLNTNAGPSSMVISNNAVNYNFSGNGTLSGVTGVTKLGSGIATLNLTNSSYSGDTTVSNGTLTCGSASAISSAANLNVGPLGTLELAGFSETVAGLAGSGVIDNNNAANVSLTVNGGGVWAGTIQDQGAGGGVQLSKNNASTLVIRGNNNLTSSANPDAQFNGGTTIITNGGVVTCANTEFWIMQNAGTATCIVDGGALSVNTWLVVGRNNAAANGTLIVNSGTVQKTGPNNIVVGSLGANGTLIVNGGQVLNNGDLWLGEGATANAALYLNGGLVQANTVRPNGATPVTYNAYFNGGTLQAVANSANFLQVFCNVMSNGLTLDDNGFSLNIGGAALNPGDAFNGGLVKKGSGKVYLDLANTYTGSTVVSNGVLAGIGSITGPLIVAPSGNVGGGNNSGIGAFTVNNNATINGGAFMRINKDVAPSNDVVTVTGNITYGGTLTVSNQSTSALVVGDTFKLFDVAGTKSGNFSSIVGSPGAGLAYSFTPSSGELSVVTGLASYSTNLTATVSGNQLTLTWPSTHLGWILQSQTNNLDTGLTPSWTDVSGSSGVTTEVFTMDPTKPTVFFRLRHP